MNFLVCSTSIFGDNIDIREVSGDIYTVVNF